MARLHCLVETAWKTLPKPLQEIARRPPLSKIKEFVKRILLGRHQYLYDEVYYHAVELGARPSAAMMAISIVETLHPKRLVDMGCGTGALLEALNARGVNGIGLEYSDEGLRRCAERGVHARKYDIIRDTLPKDLVGCDVAVSFEVAEHLPASCAGRFIDLLCAASDVVIMSAATPGQGGHDHVNEQPHHYWIQLFAFRGFGFDEQLSGNWREQWRQSGVSHYYCDNVMLFRRRGV